MTTITIERATVELWLQALHNCANGEDDVPLTREALESFSDVLSAPATAPDELERLRAESEERLQNCAALVAEVERLRKDAERKPMHEGEIQAAWLGQGIEEPMPYTFELGIRSAERFNGIKGTL